MGGLTSAVDWWQEWQLRILVLTSVAVQVLLLIFSSLRRFAIPGWARSITWLAYLAGDAVAIYALATLFNRHRGSDIASTLEVMWAPVLLIHLGGQDGITAYNIEDNELWSRHLVTAVSQVTVAIYVFCKSWPPDGDKRLLAAAVLLFIPGVIKCFVKPWDLKIASIYSLVSSDPVKKIEGRGDIYSLQEYVKEAKEFVAKHQEEEQERHPAQQRDNVVDDVSNKSQGRLCAQLLEPLTISYWRRIKEKEKDKLVKQIQENRKAFQELGVLVEGAWVMDRSAYFDVDQSATLCALICQVQLQLVEIRKRLLVMGLASYKLFVDLPSPYRRRLNILKYCWGISEGRVYGYVERWLAAAFLRLYTKLKTTGVFTENDLAAADDFAAELHGMIESGRMMLLGCGRQLIYCSRWVLPLVSIGLLHRSHSHSKFKAQSTNGDIDVNVTYAVLCCTAVLEICSALPIVIGEFASWKTDSYSSSRESAGGNWPEMVAQYSVIRYFASYKNHRRWMCIADIFGCMDFVNRRVLCMKSCSSSAIISRLVHGYLKDGWKTEISDATSYRRFNDHNSCWVLVRKREEKSSRWVLERNHQSCRSQVPPGMRMERRELSFDECVLIWHIATDICFFSSPSVSKHRCAFAEVRTAWNKISWVGRTRTNEQQQQHQCRQEELTDDCRALLCRQMSNYMVYLLFVNPEMLLPGTRRNLFIALIDILIELNYILEDTDNAKEDEKRVTERVIDTLQKRSTSKEEANEEGGRVTQKDINEALAPLLDDAWALAQMMLVNKEKMWEEIQGVWVEMLCFSASRCRGYLHAKALGEGGEFLSYVWLTLFHMGMETFADKLQREDLPSHEEAAAGTAAPSTSAPVSSTTGRTAASASEAHSTYAAGASAAPWTSDEDEISMAQSC